MTTVDLGEGLHAPVDDLFWVEEAAPIADGDDVLRAVVDGAELPILLAALAAVTGDLSVLTAARRPPLPPPLTGPVPHGGLSESVQAEVREVCLDLLRRIRDEGITRAEVLDEESARTVYGWLSNDGDEDMIGLLHHESAHSPARNGEPGWTLDAVAPGRDFRVLVVGSGVAGIAAAHRLQQAHVPFTVIEAAGGVGGVWWKNRYPGVRVDTPTFGFSYSFAQYADWPQTYAQGPQIQHYLQAVVDRAGLADRIVFDTTLQRAEWDEAAAAWRVTLRHAEGGTSTDTYQAIVTCTGQLDIPRIPDFPGRESFAGHQVHTQDWDASIPWRGARVGVIGSGASAYQLVPTIIDDVASMTVFQRSAPWIQPAPNYHADTSDALAWLIRHVPAYAQWFRLWVTMLGSAGRIPLAKVDPTWQGPEHTVSASNKALRDFVVAHLEQTYRGRPDLLRLAIPTYVPGSKRVLRDNGVWARALMQPHTTVVSAGIERFDESGIVSADGVHHDLDLVVFATGYHASDYLEGVEVVGRGGVELHDYWDGDARAFAGVTVPGFPNLFMVMGPNTNHVQGGNTHFTVERGVEYALKVMRETLVRGASSAELTQAALDDFIEWLEAENSQMIWSIPDSTAWYVNAKGRASQVWPFVDKVYWRITEQVAVDDYRFA